MTRPDAQSPKGGHPNSGKYLTFVLAGEEYGLQIMKVLEIISMMPVTPVPQVPEYIQGVINLRGKVIPVISLRAKLGMPEQEHTIQTCIIVVDVSGVEMGIIVDEVTEVLDINGEQIEDTPAFGAYVNTDFILGIGKKEDRVTILLDIARMLNLSEITATTPALPTPALGDGGQG
jgi:purine-binding chemotaxis protein CheW